MENSYCGNVFTLLLQIICNITFPNPASAKHCFTVSVLLFFTANPIQFAASRTDADLANA
jgi:hypothetical protein